MTTQKATKLRDRAVTLLSVERSQFCEQMGLLGYGEEKAEPMKKSSRTPKRPRIVFHFGNVRPASN